MSREQRGLPISSGAAAVDDLRSAALWAVCGAVILLMAFSVAWWVVEGPYPGYRLLAYPGIVAARFFSEEIDFWPKLGIMLVGQYFAFFIVLFTARIALRFRGNRQL